MKCFACNKTLVEPKLDRPTGRYYCGECMEPTNKEIMRLAGKDEYESYGPNDYEGILFSSFVERSDIDSIDLSEYNIQEYRDDEEITWVDS